MNINEIRDRKGATHSRKRRGRGIGSGLGKTGGRGHKGQTSRSGVAVANFEGGQMPIYRRLPMRGFRNPNRRDYVVVNVGTIQQAVESGKLTTDTPIDGERLRDAGVIRRIRDGVRLLGKGEIDVTVNMIVAGASRSAVALVEKAGGSVQIANNGKAEQQG